MDFIQCVFVLILSHANPTMTQPEVTDAALSEEEAAASEPEPWTPERVTAWNSYYDLYVAAGVLLLVFVVSATKIADSAVWSLLQTGHVSLSQGWPVVKDPFSYTEADQPWVNIPWVFEVANSLIYQSVAPQSLYRAPGQLIQADQRAAGILIALSATIRILTALLLLSIRRAGPGLWWTAICVCLALGGVFGPPEGIALGGIAGQASVTPDTWGLFFLAVELFLLHRALNLGYTNSMIGLVPLYLIWANVDESFLYGLVILAAAVLGTLQKRKPVTNEQGTLTFPRGVAIWFACAAVCLVNPSFYQIYEAACSPFTQLFLPRQDSVPVDQISVFGPSIRMALGDLYRWFVAYYLILVGIGLASFYLNRQRFSLSRFLMYVAATVLWGFMHRFRTEFAVVFAATLALNGQEWYLDRFGTLGRLGRGWAFWSIGGRAITIVLTCLFVVRGLTGYGSDPGAPLPQFGFGVNPDLFPFEAADTLRFAKIDGNILNTSASQGDALVWRAYPTRKTFIDSRPNAFPPSLRARLDELRKALKDDDITRWKPVLDEYHITAIMLDVAGSPYTYEQLRRSSNWVRFYDDGNVVMFGRSDAEDPDLAYFKDNQLDSEKLVYKTRRPLESTQHPPRVTMNEAESLGAKFDRLYDRIFQSASQTPPQPHVRAARRWMEPDDVNSVAIPDPARCLLAVWNARTALARRPDDPSAFRILVDAYRILMLHESALLQGQSLTMANFGQISLQSRLLPMRYDQLVTSLNYAIQTTPPPNSEEARESLRALNLQLGQMYLSVDFIDLARDRFQAAINLSDPANISPEFRTQMMQLNEQLNQVQTSMKGLPDTAQADPVQKARMALSMGAAGMAIDELYNAELSASRIPVLRPLLVDLYCETGQPGRALELFVDSDDPTLNTGPGTTARRQGLVNFLIGNSEYAAVLWQDRAIAQIRDSQAMQAFMASQSFLKGDVVSASDSFLELPGRVTTQANWEMDLGLCLLESGEPVRAAEHLSKALVLIPDLPTRPVIAYYLEKLGEAVPPLPNTTPAPSKPSPAEPSPPK
jgi:tetratricopeptide (TPR) repeat protein